MAASGGEATTVESTASPWADLLQAEAVDEEESGAVHKVPAAAKIVAAQKDVPHTTCIQASVVLEEPRMVHFMDFVSTEEAQHLMALAEGRWVRSTVTRGSPDKLLNLKADRIQGEQCAENAAESSASEETLPNTVEVKSEGCTSQSVRLDYEESEVVERVLARVATLTGYPLENVEPLVVVRYHEGQVFRLHHDGVMRPMTVFAYLNEVEDGGETYFPHLGFKVTPYAGTAVMWSNVQGEGADAIADRRMDHEALPPGPGCVKYGMNCFVNREPQRDCSHIAIVQQNSAQAGA